MSKALVCISDNHRLITGLLTGFLVGMLASRISNTSIFYAAVVLNAVLLWLLHASRDRIRRRLRSESSEYTAYRSLSSMRGEEYRDRPEFVVNDCVTLQLCPSMRSGWRSEEIEVDLHNKTYGMPPQYASEFAQYVESFKNRYGESHETLMLKELPIAWSDSDTLRFVLQKNEYQNTMFFWERVFTDEAKHRKHVRDVLVSRDISFPHNLCLHIAVITDDRRLLLTKRPPHVATHADCFSASIEENLVPQDLEGHPGGLGIMHGVIRGLSEELALEPSADYSKDNIRVLSVFLEGAQRINVAIAAVVRLDHKADTELIEIIKNSPKVDYEATDFHWLDYEEVGREVFRPTRQYHPTARYRMLLALLHEYGPRSLASKIGAHAKQ